MKTTKSPSKYTSTTELPQTQEDLNQALNRIQRNHNDDFFNRNINTHHGHNEGYNEENLTNMTTTTTTTTTSTPTTPPVLETPVVEIPNQEPGTIILPSRRPLNDLDYQTIFERNTTSRMSNLPPLNRQPPINEQPPILQQPPAFNNEEFQEGLNNIRRQVEERIGERQAAIDVYDQIAQNVGVLRQNTRAIVNELAFFTWNHPFITTGSFLAIGSIVLMFFRGRHALSIVNTMANPNIGLIGALLPPQSRNNPENFVNRQLFNHTVTIVAQTGGILFLASLIIQGLRRL